LTSSSVPNRINNNNSTIYLGDNNYEDYENIYNNNINNYDRNEGISQEEDNYFSVEDLCKVSPHLKNEIFKDIQRPSYIPNEQIFQESKKYVYDNLVKKYKILKPKINEKNFGESVILLAIQLVNKYNIDAHYEFLVNQKKCNYKLIVNVPEIIKKYYTNKAKVLFYKDLNESSESISYDLNKELLNKFSNGLFNNEKNQNEIVDYSSKKFICRTPKTKRNYITSLFECNFNYDYLCPNDKVKCQIYKECLMFLILVEVFEHLPDLFSAPILDMSFFVYGYFHIVVITVLVDLQKLRDIALFRDDILSVFDKRVYAAVGNFEIDANLFAIPIVNNTRFNV
jgi:hypothetical protein